MNNKYYIRFEKWLTSLPHNKRLAFLAITCIVTLIIWNIIFEHPVNKHRSELKLSISNSINQAVIFNAQSEKIKLDAAKNKDIKTIKAAPISKNNKIATAKDVADFVNKILAPHKNIQLDSLKNNDPTAIADNAQGDKYLIEFNSNYFDTLAYLKELENQPWCISWDKMNYSVTKYPLAHITISFHLVKAETKNV